MPRVCIPVLLVALCAPSQAQQAVPRPSREAIVFDSGRDGSTNVYAAEPDGSNATQLTRTSQPDQSAYASWSHDHRQVVFSSNSGGEQHLGIYVMDADGGNVRHLFSDPGVSLYSPVWSLQGDRISFHSWDEEANTSSIYVMRSDGTDVRKISLPRMSAYYASWSPDGARIALTGHVEGEDANETDIYVMEASGSDVRRLTTSPGADQAPDWSPDGARIVFDSTRDGNFEIYVMGADGSNQKRLTNHFNADARPSWSPDGSRIAFHSSRHVPRKTGEDSAGYNTYEIYVMDADGSNVQRLTFNDEADGHPDW